MYFDHKHRNPNLGNDSYMKKHIIRTNLTNALTTLALVAISSLGCSKIRELTARNQQSEQANEFNFTVPFGYRSADLDPSDRPGDRFTVLLTGKGEIYAGNIESQPIDLQTVIQRAREASRTNAPVYIAAAGSLDASFFLSFVNELRKQDLNEIRLLVGGSERPIDPKYDESPRYVRGMGDIPFPDHSFPLKLRIPTPSATDGPRLPNPLTLVVKFEESGGYTLNNNSIKDEDELVSKLAEVFKARESNGVFRENSNEIEKTVWLDLSNLDKQSKQPFTYWHILRIIDAVKAAGSSPIVLTDGHDSLTAGDPEYSVLSAPARTPGGTIPNTIPGGILNGKAASLPKPEFPPAARAVRASGPVNVQVTVDPGGKVVEAKAVSGHPLLRNAAEQAARSARFAPTMLAGQKVSVTGIIVYNFMPLSSGDKKGRPKPS